MRRIVNFLTALAVLGALSTVPLFAQRGGGGGHAGGMGGASGAGGGMGRGSEMGPGSSGPNMDRGGMGRGMNSTNLGSQKNAAELLSQNTKLASNLSSLLPAGTNLQQAAAGFKNLGQFVAAVHVSHNLGIPFEDLKTKMTGSNSESLGKAVRDLKPDTNSKDEAKRAKHQADDTLRQFESGA